MFCSNCGKSIRPEESSCRHCGAILGENRFFGSTYTSSQVRLPAHEINNAPAGGRMSYTRTDYMSYDNQPEENIYSGTTYRPLLSEDEDLTRIEAEERARIAEEEAERAAQEAAAEEEARAAQEAAAEEEAARAAQEAAAEEEAARAAQEAAAEEEASADVYADEYDGEYEDAYDADAYEPVYTEAAAPAEESEEPAAEAEEDDESADDENSDEEYEDDEEESYPEDIVDGEISPRVAAYIKAQEEARNAPPAKRVGSLNLTPFLDLKRKFMPFGAQNKAAEQQPVDVPAAEEAADMSAAYEEPQAEYAQEEYTQAEHAEGEYAEGEYAEGEYAEGEYAEGEYAEGEYAEGEYTEGEYADGEYADGEYADGEYAEGEYAEGEYAEGEYADGEYAGYAADGYAQDDEAYYGEDGEYAESDGDAFKLDFSAMLERARVTVTELLKNRTLAIGIAAVLIIGVLIGGISWLNFVTANRANISGVSYNAYSQGIELLTANISETYRRERQQLFLTNTAQASASFDADMSALIALMPASPMENDELFISSLTIIQDSIARVIREDAQAELNGTTAQNASVSAAKWQAIEHAVSQLSLVTSLSELTRIITELDTIIAPTPSPTPAATPIHYATLTEGTMDSVDVRYMQNRLINLGYLSGTADGDFGPGTTKALKAFQGNAGLAADGVADHETLSALYADDAPRAN